MLVVSVRVFGNESVASVTYGGASLVKAIASAATGSNGVRAEHWFLVAPNVGTANVIVTYDSSVIADGITAVNFLGVSQTAPIGAATSANATSGNPTTNVTTLQADSIVYGVTADFGGDTDPFSPGSGITEITDTATGTDTSSDIGLWGGYRPAATVGPYTLNTTPAVSDDWAITAIEIRSDSGATFSCTGTAEVMETLDYTSSLSESDFDALLAAGVQFANSLDAPNGAGDGSFSPLRVGLVTFPEWDPVSNNTVSEAGVVRTLTTSENTILTGIDQADADASGNGGPGGFGTHIGQALQVDVDEFNANGVSGRQRVIVLLTDGSDEDTNTEQIALTFKNSGGIIYTVSFGIASESDYVYLAGLSSGPAYAFRGTAGNIVEIMNGIAAALLCADFGDLPPSFGDSTNPGAHTVSSLWLGDAASAPDADQSAQGSTNADGDDANRTDDEGGVAALGSWVPNATRQIQVTVTGANGYLAGWFDWNNDGDVADSGEAVTFGAVSVGTQQLNVFIPAVYVTGTPLYTRFRLYNGNPGSPSANGVVSGGEVEDFRLQFTPTAVRLMAFGAVMPDSETVPIAGLFVLGLVAGVAVLRRRQADENNTG